MYAEPDRGVAIRRARGEDSGAIVSLAWELLCFHAELAPAWAQPAGGFEEFEQTWTPYLERFIYGVACAAFVAERDGAILGYLLVALRDRPPIFQGPPDVMIAEIMVRPEDRSRGVGSLLMQAGYAWGRECGAEFARLHVWEGNREAIRFYEREGFVCHERVMLRRIPSTEAP